MQQWTPQALTFFNCVFFKASFDLKASAMAASAAEVAPLAFIRPTTLAAPPFLFVWEDPYHLGEIVKWKLTVGYQREMWNETSLEPTSDTNLIAFSRSPPQCFNAALASSSLVRFKMSSCTEASNSASSSS